MKSPKLTAFLLAFPVAALAQDPVKVDAGHYKVLVDNASVRVLKISVPPGQKSPMHSHPDAMVVPLANAKGRSTLPDGKTEDNELVKEVAVYAPAGTHAAANVGTTELDAIMIEFKTKEAGKAAVPAARPGIQSNVIAESPRAVAIKASAGPDFAEPKDSTHEYDQVVIALGAAEMSLAVEGKPTVTKWQRGDVQFIGRGVKHESKNTGGKPLDFIIVAIR